MAFSAPIESPAGVRAQNGDPCTVTLSQAPAAGSLLVAVVAVDNEPTLPPLSVPPGFTFADSHEDVDDVTHAVYYKVSDGSETTLTFTNTDATTPTEIRATVTVYPSAGGGAFVGPAVKTYPGINQTGITLGPITALDGDLVIATSQIDSSSVLTSSWSDGFTEAFDMTVYNPRLASAYKISAGASESTTRTLTAQVTRIAGMLLIFRETATTPEIRKDSQFDVETTLSGTVTAATLNGNAITVDSQAGTTVTLTDSGSGITTSGEYDLVLTDDSADPDETITVQVNVYGVAPSNNPLQKDGSALVSLTGVQVRVTDGENINGAELYYSGAQTTDASGNLGNIDLSSTAAAEADPVLLHMRTSAGDSIIADETVGLI